MTNNMNYDNWQSDSNTVLPTRWTLYLHTIPSAVYAGTAKSMFCGVNTTRQTQHLPHKTLMMETSFQKDSKPIMTKLIAQ